MSAAAEMAAALRGVDPGDEFAVFRRLLDSGFPDAAIARDMDEAMALARRRLDGALRALGL